MVVKISSTILNLQVYLKGYISFSLKERRTDASFCKKNEKKSEINAGGGKGEENTSELMKEHSHTTHELFIT